MEQALAYLILHLPDRYTRAFQVLERLLVSGALPLGRNDKSKPLPSTPVQGEGLPAWEVRRGSTYTCYVARTLASKDLIRGQ